MREIKVSRDELANAFQDYGSFEKNNRSENYGTVLFTNY